MKVKFAAMFVAGAAAVLLQGCAVVASPTGNGLIYTGVKGPVAVGPSPRASKSGEACATNILGLITTGDASIDAAKQNGGCTASSVRLPRGSKPVRRIAGGPFRKQAAPKGRLVSFA
jgi:hypothetical protein